MGGIVPVLNTSSLLRLQGGSERGLVRCWQVAFQNVCRLSVPGGLEVIGCYPELLELLVTLKDCEPEILEYLGEGGYGGVRTPG